MVLNFDDHGVVTNRVVLGETCTALEMEAGTWHTVLSLDAGGMVFEVKQGAYQPLAEMDTMAWAPAEGQPGTAEMMAWYAIAQPGDRFPVYAAITTGRFDRRRRRLFDTPADHKVCQIDRPFFVLRSYSP